LETEVSQYERVMAAILRIVRPGDGV